MTKLRNEMIVEKFKFLNQISIYLDANGELEQQLYLFDGAKKRNE